MQEKWKAIPSAPGYEVSSLGSFRRGQKKLVGTIARNGYRHIGLVVDGKQRWFLAHRLVCEVFKPGGSGALVNHRDGDRLNNRLDNLEWATPSDNAKHFWAMKKSKPLEHEYVF